jgi:ribonuclease-3
VSLAISDALYRRHPDDDEGVLSARRASVVSTAGLARLAHRLELGEYLLLGEGESQRGGRRRPALLASAFEALVGALYLDLGYGAASGFVTALAAPELTSDRPLGALKSPKSRLQEYTQRLSGERPQYRLVDAVGPDHDKVFRVEVSVGGRVVGVGQGHSRRVAETEAAAHGIDALRRSSEETAGGSPNAPELAEFGGAEGEEDPAAWARSREEWEAAREPWTEFDLPDPMVAGDGRPAGGDPDSERSMTRDSRSNGQGGPI